MVARQKLNVGAYARIQQRNIFFTYAVFSYLRVQPQFGSMQLIKHWLLFVQCTRSVWTYLRNIPITSILTYTTVTKQNVIFYEIARCAAAAAMLYVVSSEPKKLLKYQARSGPLSAK